MLVDYENHKEEEGVTLRPGLAVKSGASCELSYPQLQMFALQRLQPSSTAYNVVRALQFNSSLDFNALEKTCDALMVQHEALRTCFDVDTSAGGQPRQFVHPVAHFQGRLGVLRRVQTELLMSRGSKDTSHNAELASFVANTTDEPFDLAHQAPIRVFVFTGPGQNSIPWILAVVLHHIVTDAASSQIFWNDFHEYYSHFLHTDSTIPRFVQRLEIEASSATRLTYRDFAVWQRLRMRSGVTAPLLQYWTQQLTGGGVPPLLELPLDTEQSPVLNDQGHIAPEAATTKGDIVVFRSSPALQKKFSELCHAQGSSIFMGLLAVFYLLIERLSGQQDFVIDFVIGVPSSGRETAELQGVMGYFVNTLPLRLGAKTTGKENFKSFLASVREVVLGAYNHMEIPFHKVLEHLRQSSRDVNGDVERRWQHPLFQIMFAWEQNDGSSDTNTCTELALPHLSAKFDLMLSMRYRRIDGSTDRVLEGSMEYPTAQFKRATVKRFTDYYLALLEQVVNSPTTPVHSPSISMLTDSERRQIVTKWGMPTSQRSCERPSSHFLQDCLYSQVLKTPKNPALYFEGTQWTYEDLWMNSGHVIDALGMLEFAGCCAELHIGLLLDRGLENVAAMVGILRLNAVFVPLDPEFPRERLRYMARDSNLQAIITQRKHDEIARYLSASSPIDSENIDAISPRVLCYEDVELLSKGIFKRSNSDTRVQYRDSRDANLASAYILYTSGSTGNPKGVVVPHAALMSTLWWTVRSYEVTSSDVFLQSTSTTLDGSLSQLFSPLIVGGSARITRPKGLHELHYMRNVLLEAPRITFCVFVPSYFAILVDFLSTQGDAFPVSIKHVILAGEAFPIELARQFYTKHKASTTVLVNEYGPTEASITSTAFQIPRELVLQKDSRLLHGLQSVPIGKPIDEHPVIVLDTHRRLVPVNVPGELYIGGAGVACGYWYRPELTESSFVLHEKLEEIAKLVRKRGQRWYKTGDLVKWLPSGDLVFLGRSDAQVKHHGMRIELQEVRNVLLRYSSIKAAEVLSIPQQKSPSEKQRQASSTLVAFVMLADTIDGRSNGDDYLDELRAYLREHLPMHMVPQSIQVVSSWPRTPNGKINLRELASWAGATSPGSCLKTGEPQRIARNGSTITVQLAVDILRQVWIQALGLGHLDDDEGCYSDQHEKQLMSRSFFELGGDSLAAIRAIALAQARGLQLALEQFFRTSSLPEMAQSAAASMMDLREWTSETLVPLNWSTMKATSTMPPLFLFHDADGTVWKLLELARQLSFPVIGIQAGRDSGDKAVSKAKPSSVEEVAKAYWKIIRERQTNGPYALGGFSFGCRVAHEVARLAAFEGHTILPLILLDGLPCELPSIQQKATKAEKAAAKLRIEQYATEAFGDPLLQPLGINYRKFCAMEERYQPYSTATMETDVSNPTIWLQADLYMTQHWHADVSQYRALGIDIRTVASLPDCTHLSMIRHPIVKTIARQIQQRFREKPSCFTTTTSTSK
ncbi:Nonribosomal peptide synthetase [Phytophthora palmivora]|uniref:Nonribosomal peptide synthetase n=1 Tax=Phytophthora palmivora TaxID=4796 RepID=A0A2P4XM87_9STRA|nr:Nonribosomal peptide synthetase [Phytophthora palmivora]